MDHKEFIINELARFLNSGLPAGALASVTSLSDFELGVEMPDGNLYVVKVEEA